MKPSTAWLAAESEWRRMGAGLGGAVRNVVGWHCCGVLKCWRLPRALPSHRISLPGFVCLHTQQDEQRVEGERQEERETEREGRSRTSKLKNIYGSW